MSKISIINLNIFIITLFLSNNLIAEEIIVPKPQPKIEKIQIIETIKPISQQKVDKPKEDENSQIELQYKTDEVLIVKMILPKIKPIIDDNIKLQAKQKKYLLPKNKPGEKTIILESQKEIDVEKVIAKIDDKKLIYPKKRPVIYQKQKRKVAAKSKHFTKGDFKLAKTIFSEIDKKRWTSAQDLAAKASNRSIYNI